MAKDSLGKVLGKDKRRMDDTQEQLGTIDVSTYFEVPRAIVTAATANIRVDHRNWTGSDLFILGHPDHGVLGTDVLGSTVNSFNLVREIESRLFFNITEDFTTTTRRSDSTTASGWGTGSIIFTGDTGAGFVNGSSTNNVEVSSGSVVMLGSYTGLQSGTLAFVTLGSESTVGNGSVVNNG